MAGVIGSKHEKAGAKRIRMRELKYVSADNHLNTHWLPASLWRERLSARMRDRGPRVVETSEGSFWFWEGQRRKMSAAGSSNRRLQTREFGALELPEGALPPAEPALARRHMDQAGIFAAVFFGDTRKWGVEDPDLRVEMFRAYNDFCLEISADRRRRLVYLPNLPTANPSECLQELRRVAALGARAVEFGVFDVGAPLNDEVWEPLWEEAAGRGIVVCSHTGHPAGQPFPPNERGSLLASHASSPFTAAQPIAQMVLSGVFERHPAMTWVMAESRIGWLPFLFSWMDRQQDIRATDPTVSLSRRASDYVRRNLRFTFEDDAVGAHLLEFDWAHLAETVMWGCDYPHPQGVWPDPDPVIARMLDRVDPAMRHEIVFARAARLFGFDRQDPREGTVAG
jgi:predicted TIM-barrel fold metal-dependent hydrolase